MCHNLKMRTESDIFDEAGLSIQSKIIALTLIPAGELEKQLNMLFLNEVKMTHDCNTSGLKSIHSRTQPLAQRLTLTCGCFLHLLIQSFFLSFSLTLSQTLYCSHSLSLSHFIPFSLLRSLFPPFLPNSFFPLSLFLLPQTHSH